MFMFVAPVQRVGFYEAHNSSYTDYMSPRQREHRRKNLEKLMEQWKIKVGFEFHVQMQTRHKMFSSKYAHSFRFFFIEYFKWNFVKNNDAHKIATFFLIKVFTFFTPCSFFLTSDFLLSQLLSAHRWKSQTLRPTSLTWASQVCFQS